VGVALLGPAEEGLPARRVHAGGIPGVRRGHGASHGFRAGGADRGNGGPRAEAPARTARRGPRRGGDGDRGEVGRELHRDQQPGSVRFSGGSGDHAATQGVDSRRPPGGERVGHRQPGRHHPAGHPRRACGHGAHARRRPGRAARGAAPAESEGMRRDPG